MKLKYKTHLWIWVVYRRQVQHLKISDLQQGTCKPPSSPFPSSPPPTPHQGTCRPSSSPADMPLPPADPIRRSVAKSKQADATTMPTMSSRACAAGRRLRLVAEISRAEQSVVIFAMDDRERRNEGINRGRVRRGRSRVGGGSKSSSSSMPLRPPGGAHARRGRRREGGRRLVAILCVAVRWTCKMDPVYGCSVGTCFWYEKHCAHPFLGLGHVVGDLESSLRSDMSDSDFGQSIMTKVMWLYKKCTAYSKNIVVG
jgi:hypothetical protein